MEPKRQDLRLDVDRSRRLRMPEAIYCQHKSVDQCVEAVKTLLDDGSDAVLATRATLDQAEALQQLNPAATSGSTFTWNHRADSGRTVAILCAGTSDLPVAAETEATLLALGHSVELTVDVGVAGLHRLLSVIDSVTAEVVIVIAGMDGALPTVVAGLIPQPIIAVPTSVGYGTSANGHTALMTMLSSCAPGIAVLGIDNGYGAACATHRILS